MKPSILHKQPNPMALSTQKITVLIDNLTKKETQVHLLNGLFFILGMLMMLKLLHG